MGVTSRANRFVVSFSHLLDHGVRAESLATRMTSVCHRLVDEIAYVIDP